MDGSAGNDAGAEWQVDAGQERLPALPNAPARDAMSGLDGDAHDVAEEGNGIDDLDPSIRAEVDPPRNAQPNTSSATFFVDGVRAELYVRNQAIPDNLADQLASLVRREHPQRGRGSLKLVLNGVSHHYPADEPQTDGLTHSNRSKILQPREGN
ncbi:MAG: hypothetical protein EPN72_00470 [Nevskiaceae bacterium]|nr:MAG: hypothetical protein EPN63_09735 [Nevskiaceae bacterium]TBR75139.1 MAG: hypothetical protein EPN72_00470 [Nevskiaceae bacterium]